MTVTTSRKPRIGEPLAVFTHTDAATEWATSDERTVVFSVTNEVPNPRAGQLKPLPPIEEGDDPSIERVSEPEPDTIVERTDYTMPKKPNAGLALAYLKQARQNADVAMSWLIETAIGEDGYDALTAELSGYDDPADAHQLLQDIVGRIQQVAMGGLDGQGNAPKA